MFDQAKRHQVLAQALWPQASGCLEAFPVDLTETCIGYVYVFVYIQLHISIPIYLYVYIYTFRYIHRCCPGIQVVHRCLYLLSGWFPKYVDQSGAPNQQGLFRGLAVTWRQAHVLAEDQTLLTAARHGLAMIL